jgi:hypothetical protein
MTPQMLDFSAPARETLTDKVATRLERADARQTLCDKLAALFRSRPCQPIDVFELAEVAGISGYRTRISDIRRYFGMDIRPERPMVRWPNGKARPRAIYTPEPHHGRPPGAQRSEAA